MNRAHRVIAFALLALNLLALPAFAQQVHVCILGVRGKGGGAPVAQGLQGALEKLRGIDFEPTRNFLAEASQRGLDERIETDPKAIGQVARALEVDAVVRGDLEEGRRSKAKVLTLTVYNGGDGKLLGEEVVEVPGGKFTAKLYTQAARAIEPYVRMGSHRPGPGALLDDAPARAGRGRPAASAVAVSEEGSAPADEASSAEDAVEPAPREGAAHADFLRARGGLAFVQRTFRYKIAAPGTPLSHYLFVPDGISYNSSLSPGISVGAEIYPLALSMDGVAADFGLVFGYEKVFLGTQQKVEKEDGTSQKADLSTKQSLLDLGLKYHHVLGSGLAPEISGTIGMAWSTFELENNEEYRGTNYRYLHLGIGGRMPLGTPYAIAELEFRFIPTADLGDTTQELGKTVDALGYGLTAGIASEFGGGLEAGISLDYTAFSGDVKGEGRANDQGQVREGQSMEDAYLGILVHGGYHF